MTARRQISGVAPRPCVRVRACAVATEWLHTYTYLYTHTYIYVHHAYAIQEARGIESAEVEAQKN